MRVCGACGNEITCDEDNVLQCGHDAHAECLFEACGGDALKIACPKCRAVLLAPMVFGLKGPLMLVIYTVINLRGAVGALVPLAIVFALIQIGRICVNILTYF